jgi:hypothetical protein
VVRDHTIRQQPAGDQATNPFERNTMMRRERPFTVMTRFHEVIYPAWHAALDGAGAPEATTRPRAGAPSYRSDTSPASGPWQVLHDTEESGMDA